MDYASGLHFAGAVLEISVIDLMLSADNALVIAMCCRSLPAEHVRKAIVLGTAGAIVLRGLLTMAAGVLLHIAYLKIIAGTALAVIAVKLIVEHDRSDGSAHEPPGSPATGGTDPARASGATTALGAIATFIVADAVMSVDNIVALVAIAQGSALLLIFGLLLSIPLLAFGGILIVGLLQRYPFFVKVGGVILGWIAGEMAVGDPAIADWAARDAPALSFVLPALGVVFVLWESRILSQARRQDKPVARVAIPAADPLPHQADAKPSPDRQAETERTE